MRRGLVLYTFGNASGVSRGDGLVVIKPSGVPYESLKPEHLVITDLQGKLVEGDLKPSSDLATHLVLYRSFPNIGGVVHTHSEYATGWAQARSSIPVFSTTHADCFHGPVPVTQSMTAEDIASDYEKNTGDVIVRTFQNINPDSVPAVLVRQPWPVCLGQRPAGAAHTAVVLEAVARMAYFTRNIMADAPELSRELHDKHFLRKHGKAAYYGQSRKDQ
ncbi:MAG: L-ribulose-5-phosphate 4-epimerase AraD [Candidatus Sulfotelmatobacter sp.]